MTEFIAAASGGNEPKLTTVKFTLHSLKFTPFAEDGNLKSSTIIKSALNWLNIEIAEGRGFVLDKNRNRKGDDERILFMPQVTTLPVEYRILGTIALLRNGPKPLIKPHDQYALIPLDVANGQIYESTYFYIDYSTENCVICLQFNNEGPRLSDLEHFIRHLVMERRRDAKSLTLVTHMDSTLEQTLENFANVLNIEIKAEPKRLNELGDVYTSYMRGVNSFSEMVKPKFLKLEAIFPPKMKGNRNLNATANVFVRALLNKFKADPNTMEIFDTFVVKYEDKEGNEPSFILLKGKKELQINIDVNQIKTRRDYYNCVKPEFDKFILERNDR